MNRESAQFGVMCQANLGNSREAHGIDVIRRRGEGVRRIGAGELGGKRLLLEISNFDSRCIWKKIGMDGGVSSSARRYAERSKVIYAAFS